MYAPEGKAFEPMRDAVSLAKWLGKRMDNFHVAKKVRLFRLAKG